MGRAVLAARGEIEPRGHASRNRKRGGADETLFAVEPIAHGRLLAIAVVGAAQDVIEESYGFELPTIDRQLVAWRREDHPPAVGWRPGVLEQVVAAELVQVEISEVLHHDEGDLDLVELARRSRRKATPGARLSVDHPVCVPFAHRPHRRLAHEAAIDRIHALHDRSFQNRMERAVGDLADERAQDRRYVQAIERRGEVGAGPQCREVEPEHAAELHQMAEVVGADFIAEERFQGRRAAHGDERLRHPVIGCAEQHDLAVAPRLLGGPGDGTRVIVDVLRIEEHPGLALRVSHSAPRQDDWRIAPSVKAGGLPISLLPVGTPAVCSSLQ